VRPTRGGVCCGCGRCKHYSRRTEQAYVQRVRRYLYLHGKRHPAGMGKAEGAFLATLAVERDVTASTRSQALSALLILCREVQHLDLPWLAEVTCARRPARLPTELTRAEAQGLLDCGFQDDTHVRTVHGCLATSADERRAMAMNGPTPPALPPVGEGAS